MSCSLRHENSCSSAHRCKGDLWIQMGSDRIHANMERVQCGG